MLNTLEDIVRLKERNEVIEDLTELYEKGYRYVVRDEGMNSLSCFSIEPKKYKELESWGYVNPDVAGAKMAYPLKNVDIKEINWSNKSATLIKDFIMSQQN